ncbi:MAG: DUF2953 domain-containing protein [Lachnospiraceae bacterium]|nr:DUF2953 domain-containing protein [Lachnospiraceae bacterium]
MWHVIVLILKIIGISLLTILGLILLLLLLALFVPVRYQAHAKKQEELWCRGRITWLFHLVSIPIAYEKGELSFRLKLFGITVKDLLADKKDTQGESVSRDSREEERSGKSQEETKESSRDSKKQIECGSESCREIRETDDEPKESGRAGGRDLPDLPGNEKTEEPGEAARAGSREYPEESERAGSRDGQEEATRIGSLEKQVGAERTGSWEEQEEAARAGSLEKQGGAGKKKATEKKKISPGRIFSLIWDKLKKLKYTIRGICAKIRAAIKKAGKVHNFLLEETTKAAFGRGMGQLLYLLKKLGPRKIQGWIHFGTGDPALTGEILAGIGVLYAASPVRLRLQPDFENRVLEGEIRVKGHLHFITLVGIAWRLWWDKNIKAVYKRIKSGI